MLKWFFGIAEGKLGLGPCLLLLPKERKFRKVRKGVLPPPLLGGDGLEVGEGRVGLPLTDGYREGGTRPRCGEGSALGKFEPL